MTRRTLLASLTLLALAACSDAATAPGTGIVSLVTDRAAYHLRDTVYARLANTGTSTVGYDPCGITVERRDAAGQWVNAGSLGMACIAAFPTLAPGDSVRFTLPLPESFGAGQYRVRLVRVEDARGQALPAASRTSNEFTIAAGDAVNDVLGDSVTKLYWRDATALAIRELRKGKAPEQQEIEVPAALIQEIYDALIAVHRATALAARDSVVSMFGIHTFPEAQELIVGVDPTRAWTHAWANGVLETGNVAIDSLVARYGLTLRRYFAWSSRPAALLGRTWVLNVTALATRFEGIDGVRYVEPDAFAGDGSDIRAERSAGGWRLEFSLGFGDCPAGCTGRHDWSFTVDASSRVTFVGSRGDALPARYH